MSTGILHSTSAEVTNGASWEFWYKKNGVGYSDDIIFCKEDVCEMRDVSNNLSIALYSSTSAWAWIDTTFNVVPGTTYHVVATFDGANIKVYVNSDLKLTSAKTGTLNYNDNPYKLNARGAVEETISAPGNHTFYIFRIYGRALRSAEIRNNYNNDKNLFGL